MGPSTKPTIGELELADLPAGYVFKNRNGYSGARGRAYTYITAANGIFITASSESLEATTLVAPSDVAIRGLDEEQESITLPNGKLPAKAIREQILWTMEDLDTERLFSITWDPETGTYKAARPGQSGTATALEYDKQQNAVLELHSHGRSQPFFSSTDNADEQGFRIYGVAGTRKTAAGTHNAFQLRLGIYGVFRRIKLTEIAEE